MLTRLLFLAACLLLPLQSLACVNFEETENSYDRLASGEEVFLSLGALLTFDWKGESVDSHSLYIFSLLPPQAKENFKLPFETYQATLGQKEWEEKLSQLEGETEFSKRNDYAATLIHLGRLEEAVSVLLALEKEEPGHYGVASNLGTAYELMGQDALALEWIKKGIDRNPKSHDGSEWLHVRILESKIKMKEQPGWLKTHSVSGIDFGPGPLPQLPSSNQALPTGNQGQPLSFVEAYDGIGYQLKERLQFVKPSDPIVADLLLDYAQGAYFLEGSRWSETLLLASELYGVERADFPERRAAIEKWVDDHPFQRSRENFIVVLGWFLVSVFLSLAWIKYNRDLRKRNAWSVLQRVCWFLLSIIQLLATLFTILFFFISWMSFVWRVDPALLAIASAFGFFAHFYGMSIARGKMILFGMGLWFFIVAAFYLSVSAMATEVLLLVLGLSCVVRFFQACSRPVWFSKKPPEQDPVLPA